MSPGIGGSNGEMLVDTVPGTDDPGNDPADTHPHLALVRNRTYTGTPAGWGANTPAERTRMAVPCGYVCTCRPSPASGYSHLVGRHFNPAPSQHRHERANLGAAALTRPGRNFAENSHARVRICRMSGSPSNSDAGGTKSGCGSFGVWLRNGRSRLAAGRRNGATGADHRDETDVKRPERVRGTNLRTNPSPEGPPRRVTPENHVASDCGSLRPKSTQQYCYPQEGGGKMGPGGVGGILPELKV